MLSDLYVSVKLLTIACRLTEINKSKCNKTHIADKLEKNQFDFTMLSYL